MLLLLYVAYVYVIIWYCGVSVNYCSTTCLCTVVNCDGNELDEHKSWNVEKMFMIVIFTYEFIAWILTYMFQCAWLLKNYAFSATFSYAVNLFLEEISNFVKELMDFVFRV